MRATALSPNIEANYNLILSHEQQFAKNVATIVMEKPEISVWMFLFPFVLIPFMQRYQQFQESVNLFSQGYLFTKKLTLDAALRVSTEGRSKEEALADAAVLVNRGGGAPGQDTESGFSDHRQKVRDRQIAEIALLADHYHALLGSTGNSYSSLVAGAYKFRENYTKFLIQLEEAEKRVNQASLRAYGNEVENLPDIIFKMERALAALRANETQKIFGQK
ncbi:MAG: NF038143 family protein [Clostridia bacterium]|nr:NF038143 family protein [Clostridia bacterium]MDQ7791648.1 NF038143 family protein [Clostridia bacterium]